MRRLKGTGGITTCWDGITHSIFEALAPRIAPADIQGIEKLKAAHDAGDTLLVSDQCVWYEELDDTLELSEVAQFHDTSPVWSKAPSLHLYVSSEP